jgi:hypothetical protein
LVDVDVIRIRDNFFGGGMRTCRSSPLSVLATQASLGRALDHSVHHPGRRSGDTEGGERGDHLCDHAVPRTGQVLEDGHDADVDQVERVRPVAEADQPRRTPAGRALLDVPHGGGHDEQGERDERHRHPHQVRRHESSGEIGRCGESERLAE